MSYILVQKVTLLQCVYCVRTFFFFFCISQDSMNNDLSTLVMQHSRDNGYTEPSKLYGIVL